MPGIANKSGKRTRHLAFACVTVAGALSVAAFAAELCLRLLDPQFSVMGMSYLRHDDRLRHRNARNCRVRVKAGEIDGDFFTNAQGFRNLGDVTPAPAGPRIMLFGDSFTYGFGVKLTETFGTSLEREMSLRCGNAEVVNAGVVGYGSDQEYLFMQEAVERYSPSFVIVTVYCNDPADNIWRSLFYLDHGTLKENPPMVRSRSFRLRWFLEARSHLYLFLSGRIARKITQRGWWDRMNPHLAVLLAPVEVLVDHFFEWPVYANRQDMNTENWRPLLSPEDFYGRRRGEKTWEYGWALERELIIRMRDFLEGRRVPCLFLLVPEKSQVAGGGTIYDEFQERMLSMFRELGIPHLDLREKLQGRPELYFAADNHWNAEGHAFVSSVLGRHLADEWGGLFPSDEPGGARVREERRSFGVPGGVK